MIDTEPVPHENVAMRFALVLALVAGCHKSDAPSCGQVASQFYTLANGELATATVDPATRRAVVDQLPAMRDALVVACDEGKWSAAVRTCMAAANDHVALQACEQQLTDDQRRALDRAARGEPAK